MLQRVNMDINKQLWKQVGIKCIELDMQKKDFVEIALKELLRREVIKMKKVFEQLEGLVNMDKMMDDGKYLDFFEDEAQFVEERDIENLEEEKKELGVDELIYPLVLLDDQSSIGGYVFNNGVSEIVDFMRSETAFSKYVK